MLLQILLRSAKQQNKTQPAEAGIKNVWMGGGMKEKKLYLVLVGCFWKVSEEERSISDCMLVLRCLRYVRNGDVAERACLFLQGF